MNLFVRVLSVCLTTLLLACTLSPLPNNRPDAPEITGPKYGHIDSLYEFSVTGRDPDSNNIRLRIDWGDGDTTDWTVYIHSGETTMVSHGWSDSGAYDIRAQAMDWKDSVSEWSGAHDFLVETSWRIIDSVRIEGTYMLTPLAVLPGRDLLYVMDAGEHDLLVLKTSDFSRVAAIDLVGSSPWDMALSPDGSTAWVTGYGAANQVGVVRTSDHAVIDSFKLPSYECTALACSPNGLTLYASAISEDSSAIYAVRTSDYAFVDTAVLDEDFTGRPLKFAFPSSGGFIYMAGGGRLYAMSRNRLGAYLQVREVNERAMELSADELQLYVTDDIPQAKVDHVTVLDLRSNQAVDSFPSLVNNENIELSPDGRFLFVVGHTATTYTTILGIHDLTGQEPLVRFALPGDHDDVPVSVAFRTDTSLVYISSGEHIVVLGR
jgi:DNA-binding beta-propeller fold protein YncE